MGEHETRWTVEERAWKQELPDLPDEVIALLAPPVVVTASTFKAPFVRDEAGDHSPKFLAPAPPRGDRPRKRVTRASRATARIA
jgi:hypothetical protein